MGSNPAWDRVSKVITFFFPFSKSVTFLGKSGLKLNFEHCRNHKKEVFWIFLSTFGCYNSSSRTVLLAAFWALWLGANRRLSLLRITNYAVFFIRHPWEGIQMNLWPYWTSSELFFDIPATLIGHWKTAIFNHNSSRCSDPWLLPRIIRVSLFGLKTVQVWPLYGRECPKPSPPPVSQVRGFVVVIVLSGISWGWGLTPLETGSVRSLHSFFLIWRVWHS